MNDNAFYRSAAMFYAIQAALLPGMTWSQAAIIANIGEYTSRGKGRGGGNHSAYCVAMDQRRAAKARNRLKHRAAVRKHS